jgi:hypothetical protein
MNLGSATVNSCMPEMYIKVVPCIIVLVTNRNDWLHCQGIYFMLYQSSGILCKHQKRKGEIVPIEVRRVQNMLIWENTKHDPIYFFKR